MTDTAPTGRGPSNVNAPSNTTPGGSNRHPNVEYLVTVDPSTMSGDGTTSNPLKVIAAPPTGQQVFRYVRQVGDTDTVVVPLPASRSDALYNVQASQGEFTNLLQLATPPSLYTTTGFTLSLSAPPVAGDTFLFTVEDLS